MVYYDFLSNNVKQSTVCDIFIFLVQSMHHRCTAVIKAHSDTDTLLLPQGQGQSHVTSISLSLNDL